MVENLRQNKMNNFPRLIPMKINLYQTSHDLYIKSVNYSVIPFATFFIQKTENKLLISSTYHLL